MPTRLSRYILTEIMKIFVVALIALTLLILLIGVARTLLREGLGPLAIVQLLPYVLPISLQFAFPATALFAVSCVYGRMAGDGEVATIKASGISPLRILRPAIIFALVLSPISVFTSDLAVSWGQPGVNRVVMLSIEDIVYRVLNAQHTYADSKHGFTIHVPEVDGKTLVDPSVTMKMGASPVKIKARQGRLDLDSESETLRLILVDCRIDQSGAYSGVLPGEKVVEINLGNSGGEKSMADRRPRELPLNVIGAERIQQDIRTNAAAGALAAHTGFAILSSRPEEISNGSGNHMTWVLNSSRERLVRLQIEPWRRWAEGFSCFFFVLIGAPLAMIIKTSDYWTTFGLCFLPTLITYYPLFILGLEQAKDASVPPYGVWLGNVVLGTVGMILIARVRRY